MAERPFEVVEPRVVPVEFIDGLASVEVDRHGLARLVWHREQRCIETRRLERYVQFS